MGASLHLTGPIVDAQDPQGSTAQARLLRHLIAAAWVELEAPTSPMVWLRMLDRLAKTFGDISGHGGDDDDYDCDEIGDDGDSDGEDFLALAAGQVGLALGMLIASKVEVDSLWQELTTTFAVLDRHLAQAGAEPYFTRWLAQIRPALSAIAQDTGGGDVAGRAREMLDSQIALARPAFTQAYEANVANGGQP